MNEDQTRKLPAEGSPQPSTTIYRSGPAAVGAFRCPVAHPNFRLEGEISGYEVVFPRTAVWIRRMGRQPFVADSSLVTLYNPGQEYSRAPLDPAGDNSDWFSLDEATALEVVTAFDPAAAEEPRNLLRFASAPSHPGLYLRQRVLFENLRAGGAADDLLVEEEVVSLFAAVLRSAYAVRGSTSAAEPPYEHAAVGRAKTILAAGFRERMSLQRLSEAIGLSMFRLAHVFRRETGSSLHAFRMRLRLNAALDALSESHRVDLTELALHVGFSSHSHLTAAFRQAFGLPPSALRGRFRRGRSPHVSPRTVRRSSAGFRQPGLSPATNLALDSVRQEPRW